ncbi:fungal-specific transcription factor domain-domain-containing protein [Coniella lustricola]|uniref:Fungal-specific transcription factor domain-domain-containing protein n=1 Tax=Coniella lustricola TaxID=2025994 RepID=A0A2T3ANP8_9PEZI|nr:fungal-specific transcription factor domain-domain-containing protein [Coniella lustricola]
MHDGHDDRISAGFVVTSGLDDKKAALIKRQPMRSSIACLKCRKSKIKCENDGGISPCETCIKQGKDCQYPEAAPLPLPKRPEPPSVTPRPERDTGSDRKRVKKVEDVSRAEAPTSAAAHAEDVLSAHYLTPKLWSEVFDIYRLHFATELPFLHLPTLKEKMGLRLRSGNRDTSSDLNLVLLGVLALTARFHQDLVKYATHTANTQTGVAKTRSVQGKPDSSAASDFYAEALRKALGPLGTSMTTASVERVQAFLMLGLYEWSQVQPRTGGLGAWMYVGVAIRLAQALGLGFGDKPNPKRTQSKKRGRSGIGPASTTPPDVMIAKEIRRRTMFSCLILDRLLSCGKERVSTIRSEDLQIQLPCNEWAFDLSKEVQTGFLKASEDDDDDNDDDDTLHTAEDDSPLSRFIRLVDLWGEISKFSFAGGRLVEKYPPWDPRTKFYKLRRKLEAFYADLPPTFTLSTSNYHRHENHQASSVYVSLHMLGNVCTIMLHREYVPFLPIRCDRPRGPLDEPTFPEGQFDIPEGFWDDSAERLFRASRAIVDLIEICRDKLPLSGLVLFAIWVAAFVGQYAWHFPHMDQQRYMLVSDGDQEDHGSSQADIDVTTTGPTGSCYQTLVRISPWLKMASTYVGYFKDIDNFILKVKQDYQRHLEADSDRPRGSPQNDGKQPICGGGLEEWKKENAKIVNNGMILADEGNSRQYDTSERAYRADAFEPDYSPMEAEHNRQQQQRSDTPRASYSMLRAINNRQHHPDSSPLRRHEAGGLHAAATAAAQGTSPRRILSGGAHGIPGRSRGGSESLLPVSRNGGDEMDVMEQLNEWESTRIADCLAKVGGDIQGFSYGDVPKQSQAFGELPLPG